MPPCRSSESKAFTITTANEDRVHSRRACYLCIIHCLWHNRGIYLSFPAKQSLATNAGRVLKYSLHSLRVFDAMLVQNESVSDEASRWQLDSYFPL